MRYSQIQIRTQTQTQAQLKSTLTLQDLLSLLNHRRLLALLSLMLSSIILTATSIMMSVISEEICIQPATLTLFVTRVEACTAAHHAPSHIMLKSYDWKDGRGDLYLNPRDIKRIALPHESAQISLRDKSSSYGGPLSWRARYASVTFNQYGRGFPNGGINEAGLAVEVLWLNESQAPTPDARPYLNELEWVQYLLDTASNVQDAISSSQPIRISPIHGRVHYFMCDRGGACATFELLGGQLIIHSSVINSDATLPHAVLTNHTYKESLDHLQSLRGAQSLTGRGSLTRFVTAARSIAEPTPQPLDAALNALKRVEIKGYTKWQIAYDLKHQAVMFRTSNRSDVRQIKLTTLLESAPHHGRGCDATLTYPLNGRARGDLSGEFYKPKPERERRVLRQRYKRINLRVELSDKIAAHGARCLQ